MDTSRFLFWFVQLFISELDIHHNLVNIFDDQ